MVVSDSSIKLKEKYAKMEEVGKVVIDCSSVKKEFSKMEF